MRRAGVQLRRLDATAGRRRSEQSSPMLQQRRRDHLEVARARAGDLDLAAGDRGDHRPAAGLDVVAGQACAWRRPAAPAARRGSSSSRRPRCPTPSACRNSQSSTTCGSIAAWRISLRPAAAAAAEQRGLGAGDRRLVEIDRGAVQPVGRAPARAPARRAARAHRAQRLEVRGDRAPRGKIAAGRRQPRRAAARQQRPEQQHRAAQPPDQRRIGLVGHDPRAPDAQRRGAASFDLAPRPIRRSSSTSTSRMRGTFVSTHCWSRQQAGGEQRQRRVLVAFDVDPPRQRASAFNLADASAHQNPAQIDDLVAQLDAECVRAPRLGSARSSWRISAARRAALVDDEVAVRRRHACAAYRAPLQAGAIDQRAGGPRNAVGHAVARRVGILEDAAGARRVERLRPLAVGQRLARDRRAAPAGSPSADAEIGRRARPRASAAGGCGRSRTPSSAAGNVDRRAPSGVDERRRCSTSSPISRPLKCALP